MPFPTAERTLEGTATVNRPRVCHPVREACALSEGRAMSGSPLLRPAKAQEPSPLLGLVNPLAHEHT